jgi:hypothetical protein
VQFMGLMLFNVQEEVCYFNLKDYSILVCLGPIIQDMWQNMNRSTKGDSYLKLKMYSVVR